MLTPEQKVIVEQALDWYAWQHREWWEARAEWRKNIATSQVNVKHTFVNYGTITV